MVQSFDEFVAEQQIKSISFDFSLLPDCSPLDELTESMSDVFNMSEPVIEEGLINDLTTTFKNVFKKEVEDLKDKYSGQLDKIKCLKDLVNAKPEELDEGMKDLSYTDEDIEEMNSGIEDELNEFIKENSEKLNDDDITSPKGYKFVAEFTKIMEKKSKQLFKEITERYNIDKERKIIANKKGQYSVYEIAAARAIFIQKLIRIAITIQTGGVGLVAKFIYKSILLVVLQSAFEAAMNSIDSEFGKLLAKAGIKVVQFTGRPIGFIKDEFKKLGDELSKLIRKAKRETKEFREKVANVYVYVVSSAGALINRAKKGYNDMIVKIAETIKECDNETVQKIAEKSKQFLDKGSEISGTIWSVLTKSYKMILTTCKVFKEIVKMKRALKNTMM